MSIGSTVDTNCYMNGNVALWQNSKSVTEESHIHSIMQQLPSFGAKLGFDDHWIKSVMFNHLS